MNRMQRAVFGAWAVVAVAVLAVAGAAPGVSAGTAGARAPLTGELFGVWCTSANSCMAVGDGASGALAERWNGTGWSAVSVPMPPGAQAGALAAVDCLTPSACTAVGNYQTQKVFAPLIERWDGTAWSVVPSPRPNLGGLRAVSCATSNSCAAVGCLINGDIGCVGTLAEQWNGTAWKVEPTPRGGRALDSVSCTAPSDCMAVGFASGALAERWNGRAWSVVPIPNPGGGRLVALNGLSCQAAACEAVGEYVNQAGTVVTLAEHWDGQMWSIQRTPNPPGPGTLLTVSGVSCSAASACTAVGNFQNGKGQTLTTAERWNGTAWTLQAPSNPGNTVVAGLSGVSCPAASGCQAVGSNSDQQGETLVLAEGWNGTRWAIEPTPAP
jgi:hypothetical protein